MYKQWQGTLYNLFRYSVELPISDNWLSNIAIKSEIDKYCTPSQQQRQQEDDLEVTRDEWKKSMRKEKRKNQRIGDKWTKRTLVQKYLNSWNNYEQRGKLVYLNISCTILLLGVMNNYLMYCLSCWIILNVAQ